MKRRNRVLLTVSKTTRLILAALPLAMTIGVVVFVNLGGAR